LVAGLPAGDADKVVGKASDYADFVNAGFVIGRK